MASTDAASGIDSAARALAASGYPVDQIDRQTGIVTSKWISRGIPQADGSIFVRRFTITLAPSGGPNSSSVSLRADIQKCPPGGYTAGDMQILGTCQAIDGIFGGDQSDVDALGQKLRANMAGSAPQVSAK